MARTQRTFSVIFSPCASSMLSCRTACLSSRPFSNGARVDRGKNSTRCMGPSRERAHDGRYPRVVIEISRVRHTADHRIPTQTDHQRMSLKVTVTVIICTYGDVHWGINLGINLGFTPGYLLERHPLHPTKPLHRPNVRGSAGIPDSLAHKQADTSGRAARSGSVSSAFVLLMPSFTCPCFLLHYSAMSFITCCCHRRSAPEIVISVCGFRRLAVHLTCENRERGRRRI